MTDDPANPHWRDPQWFWDTDSESWQPRTEMPRLIEQAIQRDSESIGHAAEQSPELVTTNAEAPTDSQRHRWNGPRKTLTSFKTFMLLVVVLWAIGGAISLTLYAARGASSKPDKRTVCERAWIDDGAAMQSQDMYPDSGQALTGRSGEQTFIANCVDWGVAAAEGK